MHRPPRTHPAPSAPCHCGDRGRSNRRKAPGPEYPCARAPSSRPGWSCRDDERQTRPSRLLPRATSSMESAINSRLMSEVFMPSVPIVMPSEMETVLNSNGVPPAARTPAFTCSAKARRWKLQGPISVQVLAMPISGLLKSSSVNPTAFIMARAGARLGPSVTK